MPLHSALIANGEIKSRGRSSFSILHITNIIGLLHPTSVGFKKGRRAILSLSILGSRVYNLIIVKGYPLVSKSQQMVLLLIFCSEHVRGSNGLAVRQWKH